VNVVIWRMTGHSKMVALQEGAVMRRVSRDEVLRVD